MSFESIDEIIDILSRILRLGPICNSCLGRQFAALSTGLTNEERGTSIRRFLAMAVAVDETREELEQTGETLLLKLTPTKELAIKSLGGKGDDEECWVCLGEMEKDRLKVWAERAQRQLKEYDYSTFLVGTKMSGILAENEEMLLADGGSKYAEPLKSELNREVGKLIAQGSKKNVSFDDPDILVLLDLSLDRVELQVFSLCIYGRYRKLIRSIPQTRWPCRECRGNGCISCNYTGKRYQESVDELIRDPVLKTTLASDTVFHGAGREDIDVRMLGGGRPFVVEALHPMKRDINLIELERMINEHAREKVEVRDLSFTSRRMIEQLKKAKFCKTYTMLVEFEEEISEEKLKSVLNELRGTIEQRTPTRVSHRRADLVRFRDVYSVELNETLNNTAKLTICCEGGLYVKELISGDDGRTKPSLSNALGVDAKVVELDVINVGEK